MARQVPSAQAPRNRHTTVWLAAMVLAVLVVSAPSYAATVTDSYFRSREIRREGLQSFPKWLQALDRYFKEKGAAPGRCQSNRYNQCHAKKWQTLIDSIDQEAPRRQIEKVNAFMNRSAYIVDPINWGVKDYWESPGQFFSRKGDCEDYAIAKYLTLRRLGFAADTMRIVVLQDHNLRIAHAVLIVIFEGKTLVLDNQIRRVVEARRIRHYQPIYSVNEESWWMHVPVR